MNAEVLEYPGFETTPAAVERRVLGTILDCPAIIAEVGIEKEDFSRADHRGLFEIIKSRHEAGYVADAVSVTEALSYMKSRPVDPMVVMEMHRLGIVPAAVAGLMIELRRLRQKREVTSLVNSAKAECEETDFNASDVMAQIGHDLTKISALDEEVQAADVLAHELYTDFQDELEGRRFSKIRSGITELDLEPEFGGFSREGMTIIMGASGMGKTSVINRIAYGMAKTGTHVYLHGTETTRKRRIRDIAMSLAGLGAREWERAVETNDRDYLKKSWTKINMALEEIHKLPLQISGSGLTVESVAQRARTFHKRDKCGVVIVDYLQDFVRSRLGKKYLETIQQVGHASQTLKDLSAELAVPVIVGAQVSDEKGGPPKDPRPHMWQIQWSSKAHQDAEEVYSLFRDDYYRDRFPSAWTPRGNPGMIEIIARKRRSGELATFELPFVVPSKWVGAR